MSDMEIYTYLADKFQVTLIEARDEIFPFLQWHMYEHRVLRAFWKSIIISTENPGDVRLTASVATLDKFLYNHNRIDSEVKEDRPKDFINPKSFSRVPMSWSLTFVEGWLVYWMQTKYLGFFTHARCFDNENSDFNVRYKNTHEGTIVHIHDVTGLLLSKVNHTSRVNQGYIQKFEIERSEGECIALLKTYNYGNMNDIKPNSLQNIDGELYCLPGYYYKYIFEETWYPFPLHPNEICHKNEHRKLLSTINLSTIPPYNIFDCIEKTFATMNQDLLHNQIPYVSSVSDLVRAKRTLFAEKERIQDVFDESHDRYSTSPITRPYILLKRAFRYINENKAEGVVLRYHCIHHTKATPMSLLRVEMQSESVAAFADLLTEEGAVDLWNTIQESATTLRQVTKELVQYMEAASNHVGYTHNIYPFKTLVATFFDKRTIGKVQKLNGFLEILRSKGLLPKVADGLMITVPTFLVWTIAQAETIQTIGLQPSTELQKAQNNPPLQTFTNSIAQKLYFTSAAFPIRFSDNRLYGQNNLINNAGIPPTSKQQFVQWIEKRCHDLGFHQRSYNDQEELYDIKHIAYIAGPFSHMQKARDVAHDIVERLGLGPDLTFSFSRIDWFVEHCLDSLGTYEDCTIARQFSSTDCHCRFKYLYSRQNDVKRRKVQK